MPILWYNPYIYAVSQGGVSNPGGGGLPPPVQGNPETSNVSEMPPVVMSSYATTVSGYTYGNGTYITSASSEYGNTTPAWYAFNKANTIDGTGWMSVSNYNTTSGAYTGATSTTVSGVAYTGEWLQIQFPSAVSLSSYVVRSIGYAVGYSNAFTRTPNTWVLAGSSDGTTWFNVDSRVNQQYTGYQQSSTLSLSYTPAAFAYYRLIVSMIQPGNDGFCQLCELQYFTNAVQTSLITTDPFYYNVILQFHADGSNASSTFVDNSVFSARLALVNATGTAPQISTGSFKYGAASLACTSGANIVVAHQTANAAYALPAGTDFTIEFWANFTTLPTSTANLMGAVTAFASSPVWKVYYNTTNNTIALQGNGADILASAAFPVNAGQWTHIAFCRNGTTYVCVINGVLSSSVVSAATFDGSATAKFICIGGSGFTSDTSGFNGFLDDVRVTKGVARYIGFNTPTTAFADTTTQDPFFPHVTLLLHGEGAAGNMTALVDSSPYNATSFGFTATPPTYSTVAVRYGSTSMFFGGSSHLVTPTSTTYSFGTTDFTIEMWLWQTTGSGVIIANNRNTWGSWYISTSVGGGTVYFEVTPGVAMTANGAFTINTWTHLAITRNGNTFRMFVNGSQVATVSSASSMDPAGAQSLMIGNLFISPTNYYLTGYIDELRITKGVARYTANFTVPSAPFPDNMRSTDRYYASNVLLIHGDYGFKDSGPLSVPLTFPSSGLSIDNTVFRAAAASFRGIGSVNTFFSTPSSSSFTFGTSNFTMEFWVNITNVSGSSSVMGNKPTTGTSPTNGFWAFWLTSGYIMNFQIIQPSGSFTLSSTLALATATWHHIAVTRNGNTFTMFVNGVANATTTSTAAIDNAGNNLITIMGYGQPSLQSLNGYMDEIRITRGVARYTANFTAPSALLPDFLSPSYTQLADSNYSSVSLLLHGISDFSDSSIYNATLTVTGSPEISPSVYKFPQGSMYFSGSAANYLTTPTSSRFAFGTGPFTIEFWVYPTSSPASMTIFSNFTGTTFTSTQWNIGYYGSTLAIGRGGLNWATSWNLTVNTWNHFAFVRNGNDMISYKDGTGIIVANYFTGGASMDGGSSEYINVGWDTYPANVKFAGYLSDVRITKGVARYTSNFVPPSMPFYPLPLNYLPYDYSTLNPTYNGTVLLLNGEGANNGTVFTDASPLQNVATLSAAGVITSTTRARYGTSSLYFPGGNSGSYMRVNNGGLALGSTFTIEFWLWVNTTPTQPGNYVIGGTSAESGSLNATDYALYLENTTWKLIFANLNNTVSSKGSSSITNTGAWRHIALSCVNGTMTMYVNGVAETMTNAGSHNITTTRFNIGNDGYTPDVNNGLQMFLDDFRITRGIARYGAAFTSPTAQLTVSNPATLSDYVEKDQYFNQVSLLLRGDSTTIADESQNVTPLTNVGATGVSVSTTSFKYGTGSMQFSGANYLTAPSRPTHAFGTGNWTIEFWVNISAVSINSPVLSNYTDGQNVANIWNIYLTNSGFVNMNFFNFANAGAYTAPTNRPTSPTTSTWCHLAFVRRSADLLMFKDGVMFTNTNFFGTSSVDNGSSHPLSIGWNSIAGQGQFTGFLDDLRITKGVARYTATFTPPASRFVATTAGMVTTPSLTDYHTGDPYYNNVTLLMRGDTDFSDRSVNNAVVSTRGSPVISKTVFRTGTGSMYFNGSSTVLTPNSMAYGLGSGNFTIEFWMNIPSFPAQVAILSNMIRDTWENNRWQIAMFSNTILRFACFLPTFNFDISTTFAANTWYHVAFCRMGNTMYAFLNGVQMNTTTNASPVDNNGINMLTLGGDSVVYFTGYIDDLRITKGVARYTASFAPYPTYVPATINTTLGDPYLENVSLLLHADGNLTDSSPINAVITTMAGLSIDNTVFRTGAASFRGNGSVNTFFSTPSSSSFTFGTRNFTMEFWVNITNVSGSSSVMGNKPTTGTSPTNGFWAFWLTSGYIMNFQIIQPSGSFTLSSTLALATATWHHIAVTRYGNTFTMFVNGVANATTTSTAAIDNDGNNLITIMGYGQPSLASLNGYMDEIRITRGTARYVTDFIPPTAPFPDVSYNTTDPYFNNVALLLHAEGQSGTITAATENSENNRALTVLGTPSYDTVNYVFGRSSFFFNGYANNLNNCISFAGNLSTSFGYQDFTIEYWIRPANYSSQMRYMGNTVSMVPGNNNFYLEIGHNANGNPFLNMPGGLISTSFQPAANTWTHFIWERYGTNTHVYVNGILNSNLALTGNSNVDSNAVYPFFIGGVGLTNTSVASFTGNIDEVRVTTGVARYTSTIPTPASNYTGYQLTDIYWNNTTLFLRGNDFTDSSSYSNLITTSGTPTISSTVGRYGPSLSFNGSSHIVIPSTSNMSFGTGNFTVEFWLLVADVSRTNILIGNATGTWSGTSNWQIQFQNTSPRQVAYASPSVTVSNNNSGTGFTQNVWYHIAIVRNGNTHTLFVNGQGQSATGTSSSTDSGNSDILNIGHIGVSLDSSLRLNGNISDLRVTKGIARYTGNFTAPPAALPTRNLFAAPFPDGGSAVAATSYAKGGAVGSYTQNGVRYITHMFTNTGTSSFNVLSGNLTADILVVAGGGGGGYDRAAGGGAGGVLYFKNQTLTANTTYGVTVGAGGSGSTGYANGILGNQTNGSNSLFGSLTTAIGGGFGGQYSTGNNGGSGGGGMGNSAGVAGGSGVTGQGFAGGANSANPANAGGGGGAAGPGLNASSAGGGDGGPGLAFDISGAVTFYGGGGGGSRAFDAGSGASGRGGLGGGGNAGQTAGGAGSAGTPNSGGGGGGGANAGGAAGGNGGSGIVIVRYVDPTFAAPQNDPYYTNVNLLCHFDGASGTVTSVTDNSLYSNTVAVGGTPQYSTTTFRYGTASLQINGTVGRYLQVPRSPANAFGGSDFTIEFWFNPTTLTGQQRLLEANNNGYVWSVGISSDSPTRLHFMVNNPGVALTGTTTLATGTWYHVAIVRNKTTLSLYVNGNLDTTALITGTIDGGIATTYYIGTDSTLSATMNGFLDDLRVTNGIARYLANFTPSQFAFPNFGAAPIEEPSAVLNPTTSTGTTSTGLTSICPITGAGYLNGTHITSSSSYLGAGWEAYRAFDKNGASNSWASATQSYSFGQAVTPALYSTGSYSTMVGVNAVQGEWLQVQFPNPVYVTAYTITKTLAYPSAPADAAAQSPYSFVLAGSSNGTTWVQLDSQTAIGNWSSVPANQFAIPTNTTAYAYYCLIIRSIQGGNGGAGARYAVVGDLRFTQGTYVPSSIPFMPSYIYPLDNLSASAKLYLRGCFALFPMFTESANYPVVQVQNSAATVTQTFFASANGLLSTAANGGGTTLAAWVLTNGTPFITTWYDQSYYVNKSTTQRNATASGAQRPSLKRNCAPYAVDFSTTATFFNLPSGTVPMNSTYTFHFKHDAVGAQTEGGLISGGPNSTNNTNSLRFGNNLGGSLNAYHNFWFNNDAFFTNVGNSNLPNQSILTIINYVNGSAPTATNGAYFDTGSTSTVWQTVAFINNNSVAPSASTRTNWAGIAGNETLGTTLNNGLNNLRTPMYYGIVSTQAVSTTDRLILESLATYNSAVFEYPPVAMTSHTTNIVGQPYGNGAYISSASSEYNASNYSAFTAFDKSNPNNETWATQNSSSYSTTTGVVNPGVSYKTCVSGAEIQGEWVQLQLPSDIFLTDYLLTSPNQSSASTMIPNRTPNAWVLAGSADGVLWFLVDAVKNRTLYTSLNQTQQFVAQPQQRAYKYYRMIITALQPSSDGFCQIGDWRLFGIPASTTPQEYPPQALTANTTTLSTAAYGNGTYITSGSADNGTTVQASWNAFDKVNTALGSWATVGSQYNTSGNYVAASPSVTVASGVSYPGAHFQIQLPTPILISYYVMTSTVDIFARSPRSWILAGSVNGSVWVLLDSRSGITWNNTTNFSVSFTPSGVTSSYSYYRVVVLTNQGTGDDRAQVGEMRLFGTQATPTGNEFPPAAMTTNTANITGQPYGNGSYIASASTEQGGTAFAYYAFDKVLSGNRWISAANTYNATDGIYANTGVVTTAASGSNYRGEWLQVLLPVPAVLTGYILSSSANGGSFILCQPISWVICGSLNGSTWVVIDIKSNQTYTAASQSKSYTVANTNAYSYYRIVATGIGLLNSGAPQAEIGEWRLYGQPQHLGNYVTSGLQAYYDFSVSQRGPGLADLSGTGRHLTWSGNPSFVASPPYTLNVNGATATLSNVTIDTVTSGITLECTLFVTSNNNQYTGFFSYFGSTGFTIQITNTYVLYTHITNGTTNTNTDVNVNTIAANTWYHYVCTATAAGAWTTYLNGAQVKTGTFSPMPANAARTLSLSDGSTNLNGRIGMVRMYNRALTLSEVKQNYNSIMTRISGYSLNPVV